MDGMNASFPNNPAANQRSQKGQAMTDQKTFRKNIARIKQMGGKLAALTHETACQMAEHAKVHGDMTLFVDLFNALHTAQRRRAFLVWLHDFTPIRIRVKDEIALAKGSRVLNEAEKGYTAWNLEGLTAVTYWDYTQEKEPRALDAAAILKAIESLSRRLDRAVEKGTISQDLDVDAAQAYIAKLAAVKPEGGLLRPILV